MKIKVSLKGHEYAPKILAVGDCIDLAVPTDVVIPKVSRTTPIKEFDVNFQIAMELPKVAMLGYIQDLLYGESMALCLQTQYLLF